MSYRRSVLGGSDEDYSRSVLGGSDEYLSRSLLGGSDEVHQIHCEPCMKERKKIDAVKYCLDCAEYLCRQCFKSHAKFKAFQNHVTNDVDTVTPVTKTSSKFATSAVRNTLAELQIDPTTERHLSRQAKAKKSSTESNKKVTAKLVSSIDVRSRGDKEIPIPYITDLTIMRSHYCVVTDDSNRSVKVVDTRQMCVVSQIHIGNAEVLYAITSVNDDQVAVSVTINMIRGVHKIMFFSVSTSGIISHTDRSLDIERPFLGIIHHQNCLYGSNSRGITIISMNGRIIKTISKDAFDMLDNIALSNDHKTIYVCSRDQDTVLSVDLEGNIKAIYNVKKPDGVTVDSEGYLYVCSFGTDRVLQLTADLKKVQVIISDVSVERCAFNTTKNRLYVSCVGKITMYDMIYE